MAKIQEIHASEILNSRGNPALEVFVILDDGTLGRSNCPSGASVGSHEALEILDNDAKRYQGKGVLKAIENIEKTIAPKLIGMDAQNQSYIDKTMDELDGTENKSKLGANSILPVSMAVCKAAAITVGFPLYQYIGKLIKNTDQAYKIPIPLFNILNGGKHAGDNIEMQEFMIIPASFKEYPDALEMATNIYRNLRTVLEKNNFPALIGDEGGFGPSLTTNEDALSLIAQAVELTALRLGYDVFTGVDAAASNFYQEHKYRIKDRPTALNAKDLIGFYNELVEKYHLLLLEDPLAEDDWEGWQLANTNISRDIILTGDDLTVTNPNRLKMALEKKTISGIIIKPNQIGTVTETIEVVNMAREAGIKIIVSHRSGETNDDFIADFGVGIAADYVKFGAPARGERVAKYNRLLQIYKQLQA